MVYYPPNNFHCTITSHIKNIPCKTYSTGLYVICFFIYFPIEQNLRDFVCSILNASSPFYYVHIYRNLTLFFKSGWIYYADHAINVCVCHLFYHDFYFIRKVFALVYINFNMFSRKFFYKIKIWTKNPLLYGFFL